MTDPRSEPTSDPAAEALARRRPGADFERAGFWDDRYAADASYVYGRSPNGFFQQVIDGLPAGRALLVAEGEGRNAVYAAREGWAVRAIDFSAAARAKALALAAEAGVSIEYELADATAYATEERFDLIAIVFLHLGPGERRAAFRRYADLLAPGGRLAVVLYHPDQLGKRSGGPKQAAWLVDAEELDATFGDLLVTERLEAGDEVLDEGPYHVGLASTTRYVGRRR